jgi:hypothetical protein
MDWYPTLPDALDSTVDADAANAEAATSAADTRMACTIDLTRIGHLPHAGLGD